MSFLECAREGEKQSEKKTTPFFFLVAARLLAAHKALARPLRRLAGACYGLPSLQSAVGWRLAGAPLPPCRCVFRFGAGALFPKRSVKLISGAARTPSLHYVFVAASV